MSYREQTWHYLIREWRFDGLHIIPNGQTDNEDDAVRRCLNHSRSAHVYNCWTEQIIYRNY